MFCFTVFKIEHFDCIYYLLIVSAYYPVICLKEYDSVTNMNYSDTSCVHFQRFKSPVYGF